MSDSSTLPLALNSLLRVHSKTEIANKRRNQITELKQHLYKEYFVTFGKYPGMRRENIHYTESVGTNTIHMITISISLWYAITSSLSCFWVSKSKLLALQGTYEDRDTVKI